MDLITVVTVVYNGVESIEETIVSVINQTYPNIEYIVIDGGSADGTLEIIKKYDAKIDYWVSEPDEGLFYAMNKGLRLAKGSWINFMNSGDRFCKTTTISELFTKKMVADVIYGDVLYSFDGRHTVYVKAKPLQSFWKGMPFVHQATFVSTTLLRKTYFDTSYHLIADYHALYQIYQSGAAFQYIHMPVCDFLAGGVSDNNPKTIIESQQMIYPGRKDLMTRFFYSFRYIECVFKYNLARVIGQTRYALLRRAKRKVIDILTN